MQGPRSFLLGDACLFIKFFFWVYQEREKGKRKAPTILGSSAFLVLTGLVVGALYYLDSNFHKVASAEPPAVIKPPAGRQR